MIVEKNNQYIVTPEMFDEFCEAYTAVPVIYRRPLQEDILDICDFFQLESPMMLHSPRNGRFSFLAIRQPLFLTGYAMGMEVHHSETGHRQFFHGDPLLLLEEQFQQYRGPHLSLELSSQQELPAFYGGLIGYFSYDVVRFMERLPEMAADDLQMPIFYFSLVTDGIAIDHQTNELYIFANRVAGETYAELLGRIESIDCQIRKQVRVREQVYTSGQNEQVNVDKQVRECTQTPAHVTYEAPADRIGASFTRQEFCAAVERIIEYIRAGDVFQVNLSLRQAIATSQAPFDLYKKLVARNPSPYMAYIETRDFAIVSCSPELLIKVRGDVVETRPIAGTRSRGKTAEEEQALMLELRENEKELAEHIMLVDLERNDLGRVCAYGTVEVNELFAVERYSHVMHLVSNVRGKIAAKKNAFDIIRAVFPGGTITGAPKIRTMEIIEELEPVRRGVYTGSIGWIGFQQDMEFNIVIRTAVFKNGHAHIQAGAGIVYDSVATREYKESLKKAEVLRELLET